MFKQFLVEITNLNDPMIYDNGLIMAIIAINMTVIGLTSLADKKCVIGVDYGTYLITKYKLLGIRMYYWLIIFAVINISSLFIMFSDLPIVRLVNFIVLILTLIFAIFYFFGFIIIENKRVKEQIYMSELLGLYCDDNNTEHLEIDKKVKMNPGNRTNNKLSTDVINYFNIFNGDNQKIFAEVFGPESLIYSKKKRIVKFRKKVFKIDGYKYRESQLNAKVKDISFEYFQLFRYSEMQDKWTIDILRTMNGDPDKYTEYDIIRLYNLTRVIVQIAIFGFAESLYKYKFIFYLKHFIFRTTDNTKNEGSKEEIEHIVEIESLMIKFLGKFFSKALAINKDNELISSIQEFFNEILFDGKYKGYLKEQEILLIFSKVAVELESKELKNIINISINSEKFSKTKINIEKIKKQLQSQIDKKVNKKEIDIFDLSS
jgi:hypothetical protein